MENIHDILMTMSRLTGGAWQRIYDMLKNKRPVTHEEVQETYARLHSKAICFTDYEYPDSLKESFKPPFTLFYKGNLQLLQSERILGVVGARKATEANLKMAKDLVTDTLNKEKSTVICSGMARGIDSAAMRAAMALNGKVIAVLGSGIDNVYPPESKDIYDYCASGRGVVVSEYPEKLEPYAEHFPFRNRLIAALSKALLAIQVHRSSGSGITIRQANDLGKEVLIVPQAVSDMDDSNRLIRDGASVCLEADDILHALTGMR